MRMLDHAEKVELWSGVSFVMFVVSVFLGFNQLVPPAIDELVPTIIPCWVLGLTLGLTILSAINSYRHSRKANRGAYRLQTIKNKSERIFF